MKFNCFLMLLCVVPMLLTSCGSKKNSFLPLPEEKEVDLDTLVEVANIKKILLRNYNVADVHYYHYDDSYSESLLDYSAKCFFENDRWLPYYGDKENTTFRDLSFKNVYYFIEQYQSQGLDREDDGICRFYIIGDNYKITINSSSFDLTMSFNKFGDLLKYYSTQKGTIDGNNGREYIITYKIEATYSYENINYKDVNELSTSDMLIKYDKERESYSFLGYKQFIRPSLVKIPDTYNDGVNGEKYVSLFDAYSILNSRYVKEVYLGEHIAGIINYDHWSDRNYLEKFSLNSNNLNYTVEDGILYNYGKTVLYRCFVQEKDNITLPDELIEIKNYAFILCNKITYIQLNDGLERIGYGAFWKSGIKNITIPDSVYQSLFDEFMNCENLEEASLGKSIVSLGSQLFWNCYSLKNVTIEKNLHSLHRGAFRGCTSLNTITYNGLIYEWNQINFIGDWDESILSNDVIIHCNDGNINLKTNEVIIE